MLSEVPLVRCIQEEFILKEAQPYADPPRPELSPLYLFDHQQRILEHIFTPDEDDRLPYSTVVWSCIKKSGKTEIAAAVAYAFARHYGGEIYSIANDEEQAKSRMFERVTETLQRIERKTPGKYAKIIHPDHHKRLIKDRTIRFIPNGQVNMEPHVLQFIPQDYAGEAGGMPALTVWDELWAFRHESSTRLWNEMQPIPTLPVSMRFVVTYAGFYGESELLYNIYEAVVDPDPQVDDEPRGQRVPGLEDLPVFQSGSYLVYWDGEPRMPWHTPEFLEAARNDPSLKGREGDYNRLWRNMWSTGSEPFLDIRVIDELMERGEEEGLVNHFAHYVK